MSELALEQTKQCIIQNQYCTPAPCVGCGHVFCAHEHPERKAFGHYGQYCSQECREAKNQQLWNLGQERFKASRVVLIVEGEYCYLVCNRHKQEGGRGYGFKILQESRMYSSGNLDIDYCHFPGLGTGDYPVTYKLYPDMSVGISIYDEDGGSMWTILGFCFLDGEINTFGVGGHIEVIDLRK